MLVLKGVLLHVVPLESHRSGPTGVGFLIESDDSPLLRVKGTMSRDATEADAFGGYPDHFARDRPSGGH
ncbi:hypothetical protein [Streptomyces brevispora]|uniref:Uncharacterized protein n=1 Tax=Streptomyces brevispora TaxID=887462 RepID=A0ABZ1GBX8_9ACTN|nr:hypothetical protein [Streptomyces brevispora]WSC16662.1 hypothetical protein OIE64_30105 [Streptomyces brevispora]